MALTVHHLEISQSERVVWACEELGIDYELRRYERSPVLPPPEYRLLHPLGSSPVIKDGDLTLAESGACVEYICQVYGGGRFIVGPGQKNYADFLYWFRRCPTGFFLARSEARLLTIDRLRQRNLNADPDAQLPSPSVRPRQR